MPTKPAPRAPTAADDINLCKGSCVLTFEMWDRLQKQAVTHNRSVSFLIREAVGTFLGVPDELRQPRRRRAE